MTVHLSSNIFYIILWILVVGLFIDASLRGFFQRRENNKVQVMSVPFTESMKGLMAISILLGHYALRLDSLGPLTILRSIGLPAVTVFLFISGYCETYQLAKRKGAYFNRFILKKILRIYTPWLVSTIVVAVIFHIVDIHRLLSGLFTFQVLYREDTPNWFVIYILYCYLSLFVYHLLAKALKKKEEPDKLYFIVISIFSLVWFSICIASGFENNWYTNSFSFLIGSFFAANKDTLTSAIRGKSNYYVIALLLLTGICMLLPAFFHSNAIIVNTIRLLNTCIVSCLVWSISISFDSNSALLRFLGKESLEIFLIGSPVFWLYYSIFDGYSISIVFVFICGIVCAFLVRLCSNRLINIVNSFVKR